MERDEMLGNAGMAVLRYGLVFLLVLWGGFKFFEFEATGIQPLVSHSPFLSWMYPVFGVRATSAIFGVTEVSAGILIGLRHWNARLSAYGSLVATGIFLITLSFLFTTPDAFSASSPWSGFLLKDIMFLGGAMATGAEALSDVRVAHRASRKLRAA